LEEEEAVHREALRAFEEKQNITSEHGASRLRLERARFECTFVGTGRGYGSVASDVDNVGAPADASLTELLNGEEPARDLAEVMDDAAVGRAGVSVTSQCMLSTGCGAAFSSSACVARGWKVRDTRGPTQT